MAQPTRTRITAQEYFELPEYKEHDVIQLINGEVIIGMPPIVKHQIIVSFIMKMLMNYAEEHGGIGLTAPISVQLDENNVFEPDVMYITAENMGIISPSAKRIVGAPNLVVEILSPSTAKYDRQVKYHVYEANGVQEYWIVDPAHDTIDVYILEDDAFKRLGVFDTEDTFTLFVLGEDVRVGMIIG